MRSVKFLITLALCSLPLLLPAWANYKTLSTPNFEVYYRDGWEVEAGNILQALEYSRPYVIELTGNDPGKIPVVLSDTGIMVNGYASPPGTKMGLFAYPPSSDELALGEDWWQLVGVHEYIHMAQMTRTAGAPALLRALFGNILYPNLYQPMWMTEGITVYGESQLSPFTGRLNSGTYAAIISALAKEGRLPGPGKACYYSYSNPLGNYYVYGSSFHQYLSDTYGEDKFSLLYAKTSASLASYINPISSSFALDLAYEEAFGKNAQALWADWKNDATEKAEPLPRRKITADGWHKENLKYHNGALYYQSRSQAKTGPSSTFSSHRLIRLAKENGKPRKEVLLDQGSDFTAGYQIQGQKIYYSRSELEPGYANNEFDGRGVITEVWEMDMEGADRRKLFAGPIRAFCKLDGDTFLVAEDAATHQASVLCEINSRTGKKTELGTMDYLIGTIDRSQGRIIVTARKFWQNNSIFELDLATLKLTPLVDSAHMETVACVEGNDLVYNGVYDGQNGSYLYKLDSGEIFKFAGFSEVKNAVQTDQGKYYFLSINADGYDVYEDPLKLQKFQLPAGRQENPPYERLTRSGARKILGRHPVTQGSYAKNIGHLLWPRLYRIPYLSGTVNDDGTTSDLVVGAQLAGMDVTGDFPQWTATVLYDVDNQDWGYALGLENNFFAPVKHILEYSNLEVDSLSSVQYVPFLQRQNYGATEGHAGFGFATSNSFRRKLWYPFLGLNFAWGGIRLQTNNTLLFERQKLFGSDRDRLGWQGRFGLRLKAPLSTELRGSVFAAHDPDAETDEVFPSLRGYDQDWPQNSGLQFSTTWYAPILKIRDGLWNPNLYLEDINLGLFYDYAHPGDGMDENIRYSYGAELIAEIFAGYNFALNLGVRFSRNREGNSLTSLILGF